MVTPRTISEVESKYTWQTWPIPTMPVVGPDDQPWANTQAFWNQRIDECEVDEERTSRLAEVDCNIRARAGNAPFSGASYGVPYQLVNSKGALTRVYNAKKWAFDRLPLPAVVRRQGDPGNYGDAKWIGVDSVNSVLYEASCLGRRWWLFIFGGSWGMEGLQVWNTSKPWNDPTQPKAGCVAAKWPLFPLIVRWDADIASGRMTHAVHGTLPNYAPEFIAPARGHDGMWPGHPVRAGDRLRLKQEAVERFPEGSTARIVATGLREYGWCHGDKTTTGGPTLSHGSFQIAMDRRFSYGDGERDALGIFELRLSDFEVVKVPSI